MESKTKHRILGILVVAALIVILLPFLQNGRELSSDATTVKTPPFPDQSVQVTADSPSSASSPNPISESVKQEPDDTIKTDHSANAATTVPAIANPAVDNKVPSISATESNQKSKIADIVSSTAIKNDHTPENSTHVNRIEPVKPAGKKAIMTRQVTHKEKHVSYAHIPIDNNGLFKLQEAAWVIQVGSFKNKANALRVVNHLRINGYRAFIQQMSTALGDNTRVFVGPENRQSRARELAQKLESDMHLHGIVISYKPLEL